MSRSARLVLTAALVAFVGGGAFADERSDAIASQKAAAQKKLEAARLKLTPVETEDLLLYLPVDPDRVKPVAETIQKAHGTAAKALGYEEKDRPWTGKLTVFVIPGDRTYKSFILDALNQLPDEGDRSTMNLRGETPFLVVALAKEKTPDSQIASLTAHQVAVTLLSRAAGLGRSATAFTLPGWLQSGFARAVLLRTDERGNRLSEHRGRVRSLYSRTRGVAFQTRAVWGDVKIPQSELLATSLVEYLAFGPGASRFKALLAGFRPADDQGTSPAIESVLAGLDWRVEDLETGWRKWVVTGK